MDQRMLDQTMAEFEAMGSDHVRLWLSTCDSTSVWAKQKRALAVEWLAKFDKQSRLQTEASQAESLATAKSAKDAAWEAANAARLAAREAQKANMIATIALVGAVIAIAVSIISAFLKG